MDKIAWSGTFFTSLILFVVAVYVLWGEDGKSVDAQPLSVDLREVTVLTQDGAKYESEGYVLEDTKVVVGEVEE